MTQTTIFFIRRRNTSRSSAFWSVFKANADTMDITISIVFYFKELPDSSPIIVTLKILHNFINQPIFPLARTGSPQDWNFYYRRNPATVTTCSDSTLIIHSLLFIILFLCDITCVPLLVNPFHHVRMMYPRKIKLLFLPKKLYSPFVGHKLLTTATLWRYSVYKEELVVYLVVTFSNLLL